MSAPLHDLSIYKVAELIKDGKLEIGAFLNSLNDKEAEALLGSWDLWRLEHQKPPRDDFFIWLMYGGRGSGKTHSAAAQMVEWAKNRKNFRGAYGLLAGKTYDDIAKYQIEGVSGIMHVAPSDFRPRWYPGKQLLVFPNGVRFILATGDKPESFHGPNVAKAWLDELARWQHPKRCWDDFILSLRAGKQPQVMITTTPSTDPLIAELEDQALSDDHPHVVLTRPSTFDNPHLHKQSRDQFVRRYHGTRQGREQLYGEVLRDIRGALLGLDTIAAHRVSRPPEMDTIIVSVDPMGEKDERGNEHDPDAVREAGIVVVGRGRGADGSLHGYVLEDCSLGGASHEWGGEAVDAYKRWKADKIIGETNFGGDMVRGVIHAIDPNVPFEKVTASRGKRLRAEPVAALYEQGRAHHVGVFERLESQWCKWVPGKSKWSPDRVDAVVHGFTHLLLDDNQEVISPFEVY